MVVIFYKVIIDPGHGGSDPGALAEGVSEKKVNLEIAARLYLLLLDNGYQVKLTRSCDEFKGLYERVKIGKDFKADIFISIHANSFKDSKVEGIETYYGPWEGSYSLGEAIQDELIYHLGAVDRGLKDGEKFYVLGHNVVPAVLIETGFLSNKFERLLLEDKHYQKSIVYSILFGIDKYFEE